MTVYIGIDPGFSGAVAIVAPPRLYDVHDVPTIKVDKRRKYDLPAMLDILQAHVNDDPVAVLEGVTPVPKHGASSNFHLGRGEALWEMAMTALGIPYERVMPRRWKGAMGIPAGSDKNASRVAAKALFPFLEDKLKRVKDDGRAEALLLAEYRRRIG